MLFLNKRASCKRIFKDLHILTLPSLYILKCLMFVRQNFDLLNEDKYYHSYCTRYRNDFQYPMHRLSSVELLPHYQGKKLYNKLPLELKYIEKDHVFKRKLSEFLINKCYYSV